MKTTRWSAFIAGVLLSAAATSFGQSNGPGYGQRYPNDNGYNQNYPNGDRYGQNYPNQTYPNTNGYGQNYPNGNGYNPNYPNPYVQYDRYGRPYPPAQAPVIIVPPRVIVAPRVVYGPPIVVRPYAAYGYGHRGWGGGYRGRRW